MKSIQAPQSHLSWGVSRRVASLFVPAVVLAMVVLNIAGGEKEPGPTGMTSLIAVVATPERYAGKEVLVEGFVAYGDGLYAVFPSKDAIEYNILSYGVIVEEDDCENQHQFTREAPGNCCILRGVIRLEQSRAGVGVCTLMLRRYEGSAPRSQDIQEGKAAK